MSISLHTHASLKIFSNTIVILDFCHTWGKEILWGGMIHPAHAHLNPKEISKFLNDSEFLLNKTSPIQGKLTLDFAVDIGR